MIIHLDIEFECEGGGMGSDVQWQIDNGYLRQVMGDFSEEAPSCESPIFGRYFETFQAAAHVAKGFSW